MKTNELNRYLMEFLSVNAFSDYCPNGLQVSGGSDIQKIVTGVTACYDLLKVAADQNADAVIVHHGIFWKGDDPCVVGLKHKRLKCLLENDMNLFAYHLPLDAHVGLGNNTQLANLLGFRVTGELNTGPGPTFGFVGELVTPQSAKALVTLFEGKLNHPVLHLPGSAKVIKTIAWCSGGAQNYFEQAARQGVDAYLTGEVSEPCAHIAKETGVHYFACGHHATERFGVKALGEHLADRFGLEVEFIDVDNPV